MLDPRTRPASSRRRPPPAGRRLVALSTLARALLPLGAALGAPLGAAEAPPATGAYVDVTRGSGIDFQHTFGDSTVSSILEATGSGCAFLDFDGDGRLDLYFVNGCWLEGISDANSPEKGKRSTDRLYRGQGDGTFEDVTEKAGVGDPRYGMAAVVGDYDNDGDPDIYVTNFGRNTLYRNDGDGTFTDVTEKAGVGCELWSVGAVFFDLENDGDLDLFVGNYLAYDPKVRSTQDARGQFPGPLSYPGQRDFLYRNRGDGTFEEIGEAAGVGREGRAMGAIAADFDDDRDVDLYVANDAMENYLWLNRGDGTFEDIGLESGTALSADGDSSASMGGEFADYDGDGDLDLFVPDIKHSNLYRNMGDRVFDDVTIQTGMAQACLPYTSWGGCFVDHDNDGDLDIFVSNGSEFGAGVEENLLLEQVRGAAGRVTYQKAANAGPALAVKNLARGCAMADWDSDGDVDIAIVCLDQPSRLLRNDLGNGNHWLKVRLVGTRSNRDGIGARVTVRSGDLTLVDERKSAASYLSQNDPRLHFGLGPRTTIDRVEVRWPSGAVQRSEDVSVDKIVELREPEEAK